MKYYIDLGSNVIKIYSAENDDTGEERIKLLEKHEFSFQENFEEDKGISERNYRNLMLYLKEMIAKYGLNMDNSKVYATGVWRKIPQEQFETLKADFNDKGLKFNVVSKEEETVYFEREIGKICSNPNVLMVSIASRQTEIVVLNNRANEEENASLKETLNIGVTEIVNNFPTIKEKYNNIEKENIIKYVLELLEDKNIEFAGEYGIFIGGELKDKNNIKYKLVPNFMLEDTLHEHTILETEFAIKNEEMLQKINLQDLYMFMPNNKKWLEGSKAAALIAEAIFKKAKVKYILPTDLNIIK